MIVIPSLLSMAPMHFIQNYSVHVWRDSVSTAMRHEEDRFGLVPRFPERPQTVSTIWTGPSAWRVIHGWAGGEPPLTKSPSFPNHDCCLSRIFFHTVSSFLLHPNTHHLDRASIFPFSGLWSHIFFCLKCPLLLCPLSTCVYFSRQSSSITLYRKACFSPISLSALSALCHKATTSI